MKNFMAFDIRKVFPLCMVVIGIVVLIVGITMFGKIPDVESESLYQHYAENLDYYESELESAMGYSDSLRDSYLYGYTTPLVYGWKGLYEEAKTYIEEKDAEANRAAIKAWAATGVGVAIFGAGIAFAISTRKAAKPEAPTSQDAL